jgi:D-amino peptidase
MRIVLSADMEAISGITDVRQVLGACPEYWDSGRQHMTDDVCAAAQGLLDGGASEVVVLDNHGAGAPWNIFREQLPEGARGEGWNVFDLPDRPIDGMLQVGYHPRAGIAGFVPHSYIPGLHLFLDGEPIGESHGRIWAAETALLGIVGHAAHERTLGSLAGTPFLVVQEGDDPHHVDRGGGDDGSLESIRSFARDALLGIGDAPRPAPPGHSLFEASLDDLTDEQEAQMLSAGWTRVGDDRFSMELTRWADAREPLAAAMGAALAPFLPVWSQLDLSSRAAFEAQDQALLDDLTAMFVDWIGRMARD